MITADEVADILCISKSKGYKIINQLNEQMKIEHPSCLILKGKISRKYFEECVYGANSK